MQKKIIALAVAGLVSGAAFAQTNVTVYGAIDMSYRNLSNAVKFPGVNSQQNAFNAIESNGWDASWFGLKGTEDLGNGLTASFVYEFRVNQDVNGVATEQRPSWVQLGSKSWGSIKGGNYFIDAVNFNTKGGFDNQNMSKEAIKTQINSWANNVVTYTTPNWGGVWADVGYSSNQAWAQQDKTAQNQNNRMWYGDINYSNGGLYVGAQYIDFGLGGDATSDDEGTEWNIGASYDFKVANVGLSYYDYSIGNRAFSGGKDYDRNSWRLNVGAPITAKDSVYASYVQTRINTEGFGNDYKQNGIGLGYKHALSKRTSVYAQAYFVDADDTSFVSTFDTNYGQQMQNGYTVGLRHLF